MQPISPKLSPAQTPVMRWLSYGWNAYPGAGSSITINGNRVCNVDTMQALYRAGFACRDSQGLWQATPAGLALRGRLDQTASSRQK
ncbi:hypothetical protein ACXIVK_27915 [Paraburkholderia caledonica]|jgi:hypothetical protein